MKAARIHQPKEPLRVEEAQTPKPRGEQVLVRVSSAGICHSDLHIWEGGYYGPPGVFLSIVDRGIRFPLTPGHEIAGRIDGLGEAVQGHGEGDEVVVYPWIGEGNCPACRRGEENLCDSPRSLGVFQDGGYAEYVLVPHFKYLVRVDGFDLRTAALLACSGITAYNAVKKASLRPGEKLIVIGTGGLGLQAIQLAKHLTGATIIAIDIDDQKLKKAQELGADHAFNAKEEDVVKEVKELTVGMGADAVIDFVNTSKTVEVSMSMLRRRARLVLTGLFGGGIQLTLPLIPLKAISILGAYTGTYLDLVELVALAKKATVRAVVTRSFKLEEVNEALNLLRDGKIIGRGIITP